MDVRTEALASAVERLAEAMSASFEEAFVLDAAVKRFEFTYELAWKAIQGALRERLTEERVAGISRADLFRLAQNEGLVEDAGEWISFHEARNLSSHTYREEMARGVAAIGRQLVPAVRKLLEKL